MDLKLKCMRCSLTFHVGEGGVLIDDRIGRFRFPR